MNCPKKADGELKRREKEEKDVSAKPVHLVPSPRNLHLRHMSTSGLLA